MAPPKKYKDTYPEELIKMMSEGALNCHIFSKWNIHKDTFYQWMYDHPEFKEAYEIGKPQCETWWVEWGMKGMRGEVKGFNFNAWIAFMNNKFGWVPGNKNPDNQNTTNISIGSVNVLQNQNSTQLIDYIQSMALKHRDVIDIELIEHKPSDDSEDRS